MKATMEPRAEKLLRSIEQLHQGIDACLENMLQQPALILLYSSIEIVGSLHNDDPTAGSKKIFTDWVKRYLLPVRMLYCNDLDLYAARCGLVHTFTPDSDLSDQGKARKICYAWGNANAEFLQQSINKNGRHNTLVAVHFDDLHNGWKQGTSNFLKELEDDPARQERVFDRADRFFAHIGQASDGQIAWRDTYG